MQRQQLVERLERSQWSRLDGDDLLLTNSDSDATVANNTGCGLGLNCGDVVRFALASSITSPASGDFANCSGDTRLCASRDSTFLGYSQTGKSQKSDDGELHFEECLSIWIALKRVIGNKNDC